MAKPQDQQFDVMPEHAGLTVAAVLKHVKPRLSWSKIKRLILTRHLKIDGTLCLDEARRLKLGDRIDLTAEPSRPVSREDAVSIIYRDEHLVVIDKPAGIQAERRFEERGFTEEKKNRQPTLDELVASLLWTMGSRLQRDGGRHTGRIRCVHRLDRDTSGLMLFALSSIAEAALVKMFAAHQIERTYRAIVHGIVHEPRTIRTMLIRDRGDGLRGSTQDRSASPCDIPKEAITHIRPLELIGAKYTMLHCQLETGRTHQIRIHLSEIGHRLCGERIYTRPSIGEAALSDDSGAPRQALHSTELALEHPIKHQMLRFTSALPKDLARWLDALHTGRAR